ncbi:MAG TPA: alpha/beta hydrolase [Vicinamibacteria bacterium]|nr:alpha/beta hydrolase [Vicinamibacteria bacterium]
MEPESHHLAVPRTARYLTLGPREGPIEEVWFLLHGYGQLASELLHHARALARNRRLLVAPEGLSRFYHEDHEKVGASWMTREDRLAEIDDYVRYLDLLRDRVFEGLRGPKPRVRILGFSQGVATAARWAALGKGDVEELVIWGSALPDDLDDADLARLIRMKLTLVSGTRDPFLDDERLKTQCSLLKDRGIAFAVRRFEGGHRLDDDTLRALELPPGVPVLAVEEILALAHPKPDARIAYGEDSLQFGELRIPTGKGPHPVAIVLHGGCWRARYDIGHTRAFSEGLRMGGLAVWSLEYRRVGNDGGGWPGTFLDVGAGADHLRSFAPSHALDLSRVVAFGHSAGGHLALWLAARDGLDSRSDIKGSATPLPVRGVVSLAGITDLQRAVDERVCESMAAELVEGRDSRYSEASPIERLPIGVPQRLVTGSLDSVVPPAFGEDYASRAKAAGDDATHTLVGSSGHFEGIAPGTDAFRAVLEAIRTLSG